MSVMFAVTVCCARKLHPLNCDRGVLDLRLELPWSSSPLVLNLIHTSQLLRPRHRRQQLGRVLGDSRYCAGLEGGREAEEKGDCGEIGQQ